MTLRGLFAFVLLAPTLLPAPAAAAAAALRFEPATIAGTRMNLPSGWQRQQDDYSLILSEAPQQQHSAVLALFALAAQPGHVTTPAQLADVVLTQLDLGSQGFSARLVEERMVGDALYRLHALQHGERFGYLASYSHTDPATGALIHMFFSALEQRFIELGGSVLPLVAFAGLDPALIERIKAESVQASSASGAALNPASGLAQGYVDACGNRHQNARTPAEQQQAEAWCLQAMQTASQISRMGHETSMKILYNMDSGWCYRGESDCE
jgi:hypothetical protein